jgi:hypothetical protein
VHSAVDAPSSRTSYVVPYVIEMKLQRREVPPFVSTVSAIRVEIGRPQSIDRLVKLRTSRVSPHMATLVESSILLDKLGVTGSSPVPPT